MVTNLSRYLTTRVVDAAGGGVVSLEPRSAQREGLANRSAVAITWSRARIELAMDAGDRLILDVEARFDKLNPSESMRTVNTLPGSAMNKEKLYFLTLLVLCEPRLQDASQIVVPSDQQVCDRLRQAGLDPAATLKMVERRLVDAREHLGLSRARLSEADVPNSSLRSLVVDTAIATGAVTRADLADHGLI